MVLESIHDLRRKSPWHHLARAENARFSAYSLWMARAAECADLASSIRYHGTPAIALSEAFKREAALSIELILKAAVARRIEVGATGVGGQEVPSTHDVVRLWGMTGLVPFSRLQDRIKKTLLEAHLILTGAGRYAAPNKGKEDYESEILNRINAVTPVVRKLGDFEIRQASWFGWDDIDAVYQMVAGHIEEMRD